MELAPENPRYLYWLAETKVRTKAPEKGTDAAFTKVEMDYSQAMPLIERAIKADPKFLPAHYALAMMQPTAEKRIAELEKVAKLDPGNAQPYLLMATEVWNSTLAKKGPGGSGKTEILPSDWQKISELIEKVNASKTFAWRRPAQPSLQDVAVSTNGKAWPAVAVNGQLTFFADAFSSELGGEGYRPGTVTSGQFARTLAQEAVGAARAAHKDGKTEQALQLLGTMRAFAASYAAHEPHTLMPFMQSFAVRFIAASEETKLLEQTGDKDRLKAVTSESTRWKEATALCEDVTKKTLVTVDSVALSATQKLQYIDYEAERIGARNVLVKAGILR